MKKFKTLLLGATLLLPLITSFTYSRPIDDVIASEAKVQMTAEKPVGEETPTEPTTSVEPETPTEPETPVVPEENHDIKTEIILKTEEVWEKIAPFILTTVGSICLQDVVVFIAFLVNRKKNKESKENISNMVATNKENSKQYEDLVTKINSFEEEVVSQIKENNRRIEQLLSKVETLLSEIKDVSKNREIMQILIQILADYLGTSEEAIKSGVAKKVENLLKEIDN